MTYEEFLGHIQHRARLASLGEAIHVTRATLETLGERLYGGAAGNLAAQLPEEIGRLLTEPKNRESFGVDEFFQRVDLREGNAGLPQAIFHSQEVISVVAEAVSPGALAHVRAQLPSEYDRLFERGIARSSS